MEQFKQMHVKLIVLATGEEFRNCMITPKKEPTEEFYELITADSKRYLINISYVAYMLLN